MTWAKQARHNYWRAEVVQACEALDRLEVELSSLRATLRNLEEPDKTSFEVAHLQPKEQDHETAMAEVYRLTKETGFVPYMTSLLTKLLFPYKDDDATASTCHDQPSLQLLPGVETKKAQ